MQSGEWEVGARTVPGVPGRIPDFATVWVRWRGRVVLFWDEGIGRA